MSVTIGTIDTFPDVQPSKEQALKVLEESAEVFGAWQLYHDWRERMPQDESAIALFRECIVDECADVLQATCNLLAAIGVDDMRAAMQACRARNVERGRL